MLEIGFTGTQRGMTDRQEDAMAALLGEIKPHRLHHGDCVGADHDVHVLAMLMGLSVELHPPVDDRKRAFCKGVLVIHVARPYLDRNKVIVESTGLLVAAPYTLVEERRSGTWSTVRYARRMRKPVIILDP